MLDLDLFDPSAQYRAQKYPAPSPALVTAAREHGVVDAVICRKSRASEGRYEILRNLVSWRTAQEAQLPKIPTVICDISDNAATELVRADIESWSDDAPPSSNKIDPITEARQYRHEYLAEKGPYRRRISTLANRHNVTRALIWQKLAILELPDKVQQLGLAGKLTFGHLRTLRGLPDDVQVELATAAAAQRVSVKALLARTLARKKNLPPPALRKKVSRKQPHRAQPDPDIRLLEESLQGRLGCRVRLDNNTLAINVAGDVEVLAGVLETCKNSLKMPGCVTTFDSHDLILSFSERATLDRFLAALRVGQD